jgi:pyrimidine operon attenuation protein/uracil phosphoribosyltransferase
MATKVKILNEEQINQKIKRIAYQVVEDCYDESEIVIAGVENQGSIVATRLGAVIESISDIKVKLVSLDINKRSSFLQVECSVDVSECANKAIVIVDDVLDSGRTLIYGLGIFLNVPTKKIRTAVLVDRSHRLFPIHIDFVGVELSTVAQEHIEVKLGSDNIEDAVYLM